MFTVHDFLPSAIIDVLGEAPALPPGLETEVQGLWEAEQERRSNPLFNGRILSASDIAPSRITGHVVEYRRWVAQRARPDLFVALRVRPVAVSGLLQCADGVVFGRRAGTTTQDAGMWELVPSGGVDTSDVERMSRADIRGQILTELHEEVGLTPDKVTEVMPFCLVDDHDSHVIDIGIGLKAPGLAADEVLRAHRESGSGEYGELAVVAQEHLAEFIERMSPGVVSVSLALLHEYERLDYRV